MFSLFTIPYLVASIIFSGRLNRLLQSPLTSFLFLQLTMAVDGRRWRWMADAGEWCLVPSVGNNQSIYCLHVLHPLAAASPFSPSKTHTHSHFSSL
ncbi:hypothetical protein QVD17_40345 [Tagetes erecta]|uniref:Uncharacterized protein n=1 Tax=Tagetes erecta TaxID=13708 RepID=A0AAD8NAP7_TARER|nr:hypothetical protein QVD17_40345 [Tagetes erecta]